MGTTRRDALYNPVGCGQPCVLIGGDVPVVAYGQQFAFPEQKVGVVRAAVCLVADGEGFVDQPTARRHAGQDARDQGPPQVVGHHNQVKHTRIAGCRGLKRPGRGFKVSANHRRPPRRDAQGALISVNSSDTVPAFGEPSAVAPLSAGNIQDRARGGQDFAPACDPIGRWADQVVGVAVHVARGLHKSGLGCGGRSKNRRMTCMRLGYQDLWCPRPPST